MTREESEKIIATIIQECRFQAEHNQIPGGTKSGPNSLVFRPDIRRVSMIYSLYKQTIGEAPGNGLEIGSGYGYLLFSLARMAPEIHWSAIEHPGRDYVDTPAYLKAFQTFRCSLTKVDMMRETLPFPDNTFSVVTFSEVLEHLPVERLGFVLSEIARVTSPGGVVIASSPNQASLENRLLLLRGRSILEMPDPRESAGGTFGHIRLYTASEMVSAMSQRGFHHELTAFESNSAGYRGQSDKDWRRTIHRIYERAEHMLPILRPMADSWFVALRKAQP